MKIAIAMKPMTRIPSVIVKNAIATMHVGFSKATIIRCITLFANYLIDYPPLGVSGRKLPYLYLHWHGMDVDF